MLGTWFASIPPTVEMAGSADYGTLADLHGLCFAREWSEDEIVALLAGDGVFAMVLRRGSPWSSCNPLGFVLARAVADEAEILTVAVHPNHRGRGYGRLLMEAALRHLYAERIAHVFLEVEAANGPAQALYRRLGFTVVGERKGYYASTEGPASALVMRADVSRRRHCVT